MPASLRAGLAGLLLLATARPSAAESASALVMPFDATAGSVSFLVASHPRNEVAPGGVRTHWAFWDETCEPLLSTIVCLPPDGSVVVDPTRIEGAEQGGDLSGHRGFATVTAYEVAGVCDRADTSRAPLADRALIGSFTLASVDAGLSFGGRAIALRSDSDGAFIDLPGDQADAVGRQAALRLQSFDPGRLDVSRLILLPLRERAGSGTFRAFEVGPADRVRADVRFVAEDGASVDLGSVSIGCTLFSSLHREGVPTLLAPGGPGDAILSGGFVAFEDLLAGDAPVGGATWLFGFHAQAVGSFGALVEGDGTLAARMQPTPGATSSVVALTPTARPSATPAVHPSATPARTPAASQTPDASPTPRPTVTGVVPTGTAASVTPGPTASVAPTSTPLGPTPQPTPSAPRTPGSSTSPPRTPTPTPVPNSTPTPGAPTPLACTTLTVNVRTSYGPVAPREVSGVVATVTYPAALAIPGSGGDPSVAARVTNTSGANGLFQATDTDSALRIGLVSVSAPIAEGPFARVVFDCAGGVVPPASALGCALEASTLDGALVPTATCATENQP